MIINFRAHEINQNTYKLIQIPTLKKQKKKFPPQPPSNKQVLVRFLDYLQMENKQKRQCVAEEAFCVSC